MFFDLSGPFLVIPENLIKIRPPVLELVFEDFSRSPGVTLGHLKSSWNILTIFFGLSGLFLVIPENLKKNPTTGSRVVF
jgi:hypothetical protein